ncbi:hypothetical protein WDW89_00610 [Deltaproteobacteria bacterium TL4]
MKSSFLLILRNLIVAGSLLLGLSSCSSTETDACPSYNLLCTRSAEAKLTVSPGPTVSVGTQVILSAEDSTYDTIDWFQNQSLLSTCADQPICVKLMDTPGEYVFKIVIAVESNGYNLDSEDISSLTVTVE